MSSCHHGLKAAAEKSDGRTRQHNRGDEGAYSFTPKDSAFCQLCNAWRGSLGLEPTPDLYVRHMVEIMREVRRVLRDDATVWINLGDSYNSQGGHPQVEQDGRANRAMRSQMKGANVKGLKPKDLIGIPWRVALALQADGWWLRSDIIWAKPNPMPESVTDRPTKSHEYLFLLSKRARYFYDQEAVREPHPQSYWDRMKYPVSSYETQSGQSSWVQTKDNPGRKILQGTSGRNRRTVWEIATKPYPEAHFATYPPKLIEPCILAGTSERGVCSACGAPWRRVLQKTGGTLGKSWHDHEDDLGCGMRQTVNGVPRATAIERKEREHPYQVTTLGWRPGCECGREDVRGYLANVPRPGKQGTQKAGPHAKLFQNSTQVAGNPEIKQTVGWDAACECAESEPIPAIVLDPFMGAGTTALVALQHNRRFFGIELNPSYIALAEKRIQAVQPRLL